KLGLILKCDEHIWQDNVYFQAIFMDNFYYLNSCTDFQQIVSQRYTVNHTVQNNFCWRESG
ncbi:MAG: hypothetical protein JXR87_02910, partial [Candidatus Marinimicrobia bacterium]|nr:hypothetical protein [Candidatus Neomarinimicrobiota bacterium]